MDALRMQQLEDKAGRVGLSDDEATELGKLYAEASGKPYEGVAEERAKQAEEAASLRVRDERRQKRRMWPFGMREKKLYTNARSLELGGTATPPEDAEEAA